LTSSSSGTSGTADIIKIIGHLSHFLKQKLNACLKAALELP